jgi:hypothetical protein
MSDGGEEVGGLPADCWALVVSFLASDAHGYKCVKEHALSMASLACASKCTQRAVAQSEGYKAIADARGITGVPTPRALERVIHFGNADATARRLAFARDADVAMAAHIILGERGTAGHNRMTYAEVLIRASKNKREVVALQCAVADTHRRRSVDLVTLVNSRRQGICDALGRGACAEVKCPDGMHVVHLSASSI